MALGSTRGFVIPGRSTTVTPSWTNPSNAVTNVYSAAVNQQAGDYDKIQGRYDDIIGQAKTNATKANSVVSPQVQTVAREYQPGPGYQRSEMVSNLAGQLQNFADTGGYSGDDITAFRARGLSPIRSIYATAQNNLRRNKAVQGGYSPNYGAMQAKLAREQSGIIGQHTMDLNANIAERVQQGKQFGLSGLAPLAQQDNSLSNQFTLADTQARNSFESANVDDANKAAILNAQILADSQARAAGVNDNSVSQQLAANSGAANLYGTTPALVSTFGNQVLASNAQNLQGQVAAAAAAPTTPRRSISGGFNLNNLRR